MHGILNLSKPAGPTSHDIVVRVRKILGEKRVGHAGTLDPMATGVLVVAVGKATRIAEYLVAQDKEYLAEMVLGRTTTSQDAEGEVTSETDAGHITREMVEGVLPRFTGRILQVPPMVSAVKHEGKRLYDLARREIEVERQPREITIYELEITSFDGISPDLTAHGSQLTTRAVGLKVVCSSGTYIRTLCADIGQALAVGGYMKSLVRTRVGRFDLASSVDLEALEQAASESGAGEMMISMDEALSEYPAVAVDGVQADLVVHGGAVPTSLSGSEGELVRVRTEDGALLAVGRLHPRGAGSIVKPEKVFVEAGT